jgi:hypothetical protein
VWVRSERNQFSALRAISGLRRKIVEPDEQDVRRQIDFRRPLPRR